MCEMSNNPAACRVAVCSVTIDEWYFSIAYEIAEELALPNPELFWTQHEHLTPVHRWYRWIRNELLALSLERVEGPLGAEGKVGGESVSVEVVRA